LGVIYKINPISLLISIFFCIMRKNNYVDVNFMARKNPPKLLVIFDTNVLFTQVASDLVQSKVKRIISENSSHHDLVIKWYLPEVVIGERRYQMLNKAKDLLPNMQKLERLLGHKFGVSEETLELHVDNAIKKGREECGLEVASIDPKKIDWEDLVSRSVSRTPPFEEGDKEKGFRDSIIGHTFLQLHKNAPSTPSVCRLAFVSQDKILKTYISEFTGDSKNIRMFDNLDELESLINTLVATIPEELASILKEKAKTLFFEEENDKSLYYKEAIKDQIKTMYPDKLNARIKHPAKHLSIGTSWVANPVFIKKERQRIYWTTSIKRDYEIYHFGDTETPSTIHQSKLAALAGRRFRTPVPDKVIDSVGKEIFEVHWSTNLSQAQNLTLPKIEKILYVGTEPTEEADEEPFKNLFS